MSFSSDIKKELNKSSTLINKDIVKYELAGYLISGNVDVLQNKKIKFSTESDYNINRFSKLLSNLEINHNIEISGNNFVIIAIIKDINLIKFKENKIYLNNILNAKEEFLKATIRGTFLGSGSINNPEKKYHMEIVLSNKENLDLVKKILHKLNINVKELDLTNRHSIYLKDGEEISNLLALIGASNAVLKFEDIRVQREMKGKINRIVNCETANLNKTINASIQQISAIEKIKKSGNFNKLDEGLKEIAILRLENPNMSLVELGKKMKNPIGKSGVNYRLKKIIEIAENYK